MKRFVMDRPIMVKRWRVEWVKHGRDFANCHCGLGAGTMRKHKPYESHPSSSCGVCRWERFYSRQKRRKTRYEARASIAEGLISPYIKT